jgi:uncharacterized protein YdeI (BOF family)
MKQTGLDRAPKRSAAIASAVASILAVSAVALAIAAGCGRTGGGSTFGEKMSGLAPTRVGDILAGPAEFEGKTVALEGEIAQECPTGCWFNLQDKTGAIHVDIRPSGFAIPQHIGRGVEVEGRVVVRGGQVMVVGRGVRIK